MKNRFMLSLVILTSAYHLRGGQEDETPSPTRFKKQDSFIGMPEKKETNIEQDSTQSYKKEDFYINSKGSFYYKTNHNTIQEWTFDSKEKCNESKPLAIQGAGMFNECGYYSFPDNSNSVSCYTFENKFLKTVLLKKKILHKTLSDIGFAALTEDKLVTYFEKNCEPSLAEPQTIAYENLSHMQLLNSNELLTFNNDLNWNIHGPQEVKKGKPLIKRVCKALCQKPSQNSYLLINHHQTIEHGYTIDLYDTEKTTLETLCYFESKSVPNAQLYKNKIIILSEDMTNNHTLLEYDISEKKTEKRHFFKEELGIVFNYRKIEESLHIVGLIENKIKGTIFDLREKPKS